jgi:uncharacterized protein YxeA
MITKILLRFKTYLIFIGIIASLIGYYKIKINRETKFLKKELGQATKKVLDQDHYINDLNTIIKTQNDSLSSQGFDLVNYKNNVQDLQRLVAGFNKNLKKCQAEKVDIINTYMEHDTCETPEPRKKRKLFK